MKESQSVTKDPICGMTVDEAPALHAARDGKNSTFAVTAVGKSFRPRPPVLSRRISLEAAVGKHAANAGVISVTVSRVAIPVIRADEERMIARGAPHTRTWHGQ